MSHRVYVPISLVSTSTGAPRRTSRTGSAFRSSTTQPFPSFAWLQLPFVLSARHQPLARTLLASLALTSLPQSPHSYIYHHFWHCNIPHLAAKSAHNLPTNHPNLQAWSSPFGSQLQICSTVPTSPIPSFRTISNDRASLSSCTHRIPSTWLTHIPVPLPSTSTVFPQWTLSTYNQLSHTKAKEPPPVNHHDPCLVFIFIFLFLLMALPLCNHRSLSPPTAHPLVIFQTTFLSTMAGALSFSGRFNLSCEILWPLTKEPSWHPFKSTTFLTMLNNCIPY